MGMYSRLQLRKTGEEIAVASLHLRSGDDDEAKADRRVQAQNVIDALPSDIPIIIGADLNSPPEDNVVPRITSLGVESAYNELPSGGLAWTTWKDRVAGEQPDKIGIEFKHVIDHIFSSKHFRVLRLLDIPDDAEILETASGKRTLLPHERYPSGHMSIMAELELKGTKIPECSGYCSSARGYSTFFGTILAVAVMLM